MSIESGQVQILFKAIITVVGASAGVLALLLANYLYTGDFLRTGHHVLVSAVFDQPGGAFSLQRLHLPSLAKSHLGHGLFAGMQLWSLDGDLTATQKIFWQLFLWVVFLAGLLRVTLALLRGERRSLFVVVLAWAVVLPCCLLIYFGCYWWPFESRYMLRVLPFFYLVAGIGWATIVAWWGRLTGGARWISGGGGEQAGNPGWGVAFQIALLLV